MPGAGAPAGWLLAALLLQGAVDWALGPPGRGEGRGCRLLAAAAAGWRVALAGAVGVCWLRGLYELAGLAEGDTVLPHCHWLSSLRDLHTNLCCKCCHFQST